MFACYCRIKTDKGCLYMVEFPAATMIEIQGRPFEIFEAGAPSDGLNNRTTIVLCHGFPELAYSWRYQVQPLVDAGFHVLMPNQRGYGRSYRPNDIESYDIHHLTNDLRLLLDYFNIDQAYFIGHDWGALVVWQLGLLHPDRLLGIGALSVPFMPRSTEDPITLWERILGPDFYIVHFNRQFAVADKIFEANCAQFLRNLYRTRLWQASDALANTDGNTATGMMLIQLADAKTPSGDPIMSEAELAVFIDAFQHSGFSAAINWYRNFSRNWATTPSIVQRIIHPSLMIYGQYDIVPQAANMSDYVANLETHTIAACGHWIQQEKPDEVNQILLRWLAKTEQAR